MALALATQTLNQNIASYLPPTPLSPNTDTSLSSGMDPHNDGGPFSIRSVSAVTAQSGMGGYANPHGHGHGGGPLHTSSFMGSLANSNTTTTNVPLNYCSNCGLALPSSVASQGIGIGSGLLGRSSNPLSSLAAAAANASHPSLHSTGSGTSWNSTDSRWDPRMSVEEVRKEEIKRVCWTSLTLVAAYTAHCAAFRLDPLNPWFMQAENVSKTTHTHVFKRSGAGISLFPSPPH